MEIILATSNPHKVKEINEIAEGSGIEFVLPREDFNPVEDGETFLENATKKAEAALGEGLPVLADDSGLCILALNGAPGIYSARFAGTQEEKINKVLNLMKDVSCRRARFVCTMVLLDKDGKNVFQTIGECGGFIAKQPRGKNGFGYDPIFVVDDDGRTMAEMPEDEKNRISHRGKALQYVIKWLQNNKI